MVNSIWRLDRWVLTSYIFPLMGAVVATTKMQEHAGSDKSCVWHALDFADCELKEEMFAIRFGSVESEHYTPNHLSSFRALFKRDGHCHAMNL